MAVHDAVSYDLSDLNDHSRRDAAIDALDDGDLLLAVVMLVADPLGPGVAHDTACLDVAQLGMRAKTTSGAAAIFRRGLTRLQAKVVLEYAAQLTGWRIPFPEPGRASTHRTESAAAHLAAFPNGQALLVEVINAACSRSLALNGDDSYQSAVTRQRAGDDVRLVVMHVDSVEALLAAVATGEQLATRDVVCRLVELIGDDETMARINELIDENPALREDYLLAWSMHSLERDKTPRL